MNNTPNSQQYRVLTKSHNDVQSWADGADCPLFHIPESWPDPYKLCFILLDFILQILQKSLSLQPYSFLGSRVQA